MADDNGHRHSALNTERRTRRGIDEMLGRCRSVIFDGEIAEAEARELARWLQNHRDVADTWPASSVARRLDRIFVDGTVTSEECLALRELLELVLGTDPLTASEAEWSDHFGLDDPPPRIVVPGKRFCFLGKFFFGTQRSCKAEIVDRGGEVFDTVRQDLDYVVVGLLGNPAWASSRDGVEIQKAAQYRDMGLGPAIVSEKDWAGQLQRV